jgi:NADH-quinone oxidoreductase subunit M
MSMLLIFTIFLPLLGALLLFALPHHDYKTARWMALGTVLATMVLSLVMATAFEVGRSGFQFAPMEGWGTVSAHYGMRWIDVGNGPGIRFATGLDGVGLSLFLLTSVLMITSVFASWESVQERAPVHYALMLLLQTGLLGLFAALDVVLFYIFFEFTLIPLFFLIGVYGGPQRRRAAITFFLYTLAGSLLTLLGVIALVVVHAQHSAGHVLTFSILELTEGLRELSWAPWKELTSVFKAPGSDSLGFNPALSPQALIFLLLFAGFAIKVPLFPFHTWLPLAHVEAPTAGSILLAGVLLKVGGYGFLRFNLGMTPLASHYFMPLMATLAVIGIIYGALTALAQTDVKRLVAYSSVSHMGFVILGMFSLTAVGVDGATIQMINHGITTGALFACVGVLYERYHTREMPEMGGLWTRLPVLAFFLILTSLGSAAVPFLNGFVGEFPILLGQFSRDPFYAVLATVGMILGAYYLMVMLERVLFGPLKEPGHAEAHGQGQGHGHPGVHDAQGRHRDYIIVAESSPVKPLGWHEIAGLAPLMVLIVAIGVYPKPIFDRIGPPLREIGRGFYEREKPALVDPTTARSDAPGGRTLTSAPAHPRLAAHPSSSLQDRPR